jgi:hypothetical protein
MNLNERISFYYNELKNWFPLAILIALSLILIGMISIYFDNFLSIIFNSPGIKLIIVSILLIITLFLINWQRKKFNKISIPIERNLSGKYFNSLVLPLSNNNKITDVDYDKDQNKLIVRYENNEIERISHDELEEILNKSPNYDKNSKIFANWQMPLISIYRNVKLENETKGIEQIWLIGSADKKGSANEKGSANQLKLFTKILFSFFKNKFDIYVYDKKNNKDIKLEHEKLDVIFSPENINNIAVDFEKFEEVYKTFNDIINKIKEIGEQKNEEIKEHEIAIDITGGQKTISIAGALATINRKTRIIYVNTNNKHEIKEIDAIVQSEQG